MERRHQRTGLCCFLNDGAVGDGGVAEDDHDAGADVHAVVLVLQLVDAGGVGYDAVLADARVLVDDGVGDGAPLADPHGHPALSDNLGLLLVGLVEVRTDDHGVLDRAPLADLRAQAHHSVLHGALRQVAPVADDGVFDVALLHLGRGQEARGGVDGRAGVVELELRGVLGQGKVGLEERLDGANVLPVVVEQVGLHVAPVGGGFGDDLAAEVVVPGVVLVEEGQQRGLLEHVDAHGRDVRGRLGLAGGQAQDGGVHLHRLQRRALGLLRELGDAPGAVDLHQAEVRGALVVHGQAADGDVGVGLAVALHERHVVHAVQVVAGQDHDVLHVLVLDVLEQP
mmetsp:Transcript_6652/g.17027  ORF Transcript_6652/g.17027 Transcript_6652/m.17027 type:complete len:340 (+) Transcript_6652:1777-2796(+)